jgi:hypothetical protein
MGVRRGRRDPTGAGADHAALRGPAAAGPKLGLVGKSVTDSGGISLALGEDGRDEVRHVGRASVRRRSAIAALELPLNVVAVLGDRGFPVARWPGHRDGVEQARSKSTTPTPRAVSCCDCLCHAIAEGAERVVDATLTGR